jgi:hypothetical protein
MDGTYIRIWKKRGISRLRVLRFFRSQSVYRPVFRSFRVRSQNTVETSDGLMTIIGHNILLEPTCEVSCKPISKVSDR